MTAKCEACGMTLILPNTFLGKRLKCKKCGAVFTVGGETKKVEDAAKSAEAKSGETKAQEDAAKSAEAKSDDVKSAEAKSGDVKSAEAKSGGTPLPQEKSAEAKSGETPLPQVPFKDSKTAKNLALAADKKKEWSELCKRFAAEAREEGYADFAARFDFAADLAAFLEARSRMFLATAQNT